MAIRIGMAQMLVEGGRPEANLSRAERDVAEGARRGCQVVVLPECLDLGWTDPSARALAQPIPGPHAERLARAARQSGLYVVAGLVERAGDRLYNAAVLIDPAGAVRHVHRKIHELDLAHDLYSPGDRLGVVETELGVLAVDICADNFPDSLAIGHVLARMGAQVLLSPSAWAVDGDHDPRREPYGDLWRGAYRQLSRWYDLPVVGVSSVGWLESGPWKGRKLIGCSLAVGSTGAILAEGPYGPEAEALLAVDVELRQPAAWGTRLADDLRARGYEGA